MVHSTSNRLWFFPLMTLQIVVLLTFCDPKAAQADDHSREKKFCSVEVSFPTASTNASDFLAMSDYLFPWPTGTFKTATSRSLICYLKPSLSLCPPLGETKTVQVYVADDYVSYAKIGEEKPGPGNRFRVLFGDRCSGKHEYFLKKEAFEDEGFHLLGNGSLHPSQVNREIRSLGYENYCLLLQLDPSSATPMICFPTSSLIDLCDLLAVPFLIATVLVYSILPQFKNIHGRTLRCYLYCIIVTHITLTTHRMIRPHYGDSTPCLCLVFTIYFSLYGSLMWLNVICIDMWWRFGGFGGFGSIRSSGKQHDRKKFFWYSIYAWGVTVAMTLICIGMEFFPGIPEAIIRPGFRLGECWFNTNSARILYMVAPVGATIACNICLFVSTSINILRHKQNLQHDLENGDSRRNDSNKQWFGLYVKLFVMMGICWSTNIVFTLFIHEEYVWYFTTTVAQLQGFLIFVIFVCKKNVWRSLLKNCCIISQFRCLSNVLRTSTVNGLERSNPSLDSSVYSISSHSAVST